MVITLVIVAAVLLDGVVLGVWLWRRKRDAEAAAAPRAVDPAAPEVPEPRPPRTSIDYSGPSDY